MGAFGFWQWLVVLVIVAMIFGTSKLKNIGKDLGESVKGFKDGLNDGDKEQSAKPAQVAHQNATDDNTIDVETTTKTKS